MVIWDPTEVAFSLGSFDVRWYGLCWCIGLALAYLVVMKLYQRQQIPPEKFESLFLYCFVGILAGARLGHCLLYEPGYFLSHPIEMVLPLRETPDGAWRFTGYAGLASHGGTLGLMIALWLYVRKYKVNLMRVLDDIAVATPIAACFIRLGNLMNSEIVGKLTGSDFGFVFVRNGDTLPRHPGQLYEAVAYFVFFLGGLVLYKLRESRVGQGFLFGYCLTTIFTFRLLVEGGAGTVGSGHAAGHRTEPGTGAEPALHRPRPLLHAGRQMVQAPGRTGLNPPPHRLPFL